MRCRPGTAPSASTDRSAEAPPSPRSARRPSSFHRRSTRSGPSGRCMTKADRSRPLPDDDARAAIRGDLGTTFLVEAAAGTGKTESLVERMVALVRTGRTTIDRLSAVTFTIKAAAELSQRFQAGLEAAAREAT